MNNVTTTQSRALELLGSGAMQHQVAAALGVSESAISQLMSQEEFKSQVIALRVERLTRNTKTDAAINALEDQIIEKLAASLPLIYKPSELLTAFRVINGAERRGVGSAAENAPTQTPVVQLVMPVQIIEKFKTDANNQVLQAGEQTLVTIQSGSLLDKVRKNDESTGTQESQRSRISSPATAAHEQRARTQTFDGASIRIS